MPEFPTEQMISNDFKLYFMHFVIFKIRKILSHSIRYSLFALYEP